MWGANLRNSAVRVVWLVPIVIAVALLARLPHRSAVGNGQVPLQTALVKAESAEPGPLRDRLNVEVGRANTAAAAPAEETPDPVSSLQNEDLRAVQQSLRDEFTKLWHRERRIDSAQIEAASFERLLSHSSVRAEAVAISSDLEHAEEAYGEDQAVVRAYTLRMLRHAARQGDHELVHQALEPLAAEFNSGLVPRRGQDEDYISLVTSYVVALGDEAVLKDPERFFAAIGLSSRTESEIHKALYDSGIAERVPLEQLKAALLPYLESAADAKHGGRAP